jgi:hypothetical protein
MKSLFLLISLVGLTACDEDETQAETQTEPLAGCGYDFRADVRTGPSAPMVVEGKLVLADIDRGHLAGELTLADDSRVLVTGFSDDASILLRFHLPDGRFIDGAGPLPSAFATCEGELVGDLVGPGEGDAGDWIGLSLDLDDAPTVCASKCDIRPRSDQECGNYCYVVVDVLRTGEPRRDCLERCESGELSTLINECDLGVTSFFGTVSSCR